MKLLLTISNNSEYEFRLLERTRVIQVIKNNLFTYEIICQKGRWYCNCPGSRYHRHCWHTGIVGKLISQPSINEPWSEWAESAEEEKRNVRLLTK